MVHAFVVALVLIFGLSVLWARYLHHEGRPSRRYATGTGYDDLKDLADRMQSQIETLERLMDVAQPEWRKQP